MRAKVVNRALLCLSETINDGTNYVEQDTFPIEQFVDEAGRKVIMLAPLHALGKGEGLTIEADRSGDVVRFALPDDFCRLTYLKMSSWKRPIASVIYEEDPLYAMQLHPATRGKSYNPVAVIAEGGTMLYAYSAPDTATLVGAYYFPYSGIANDADLEGETNPFPQKFVEATAWMTASLYLASMGELDMSKVAESKAIENIQLL